MHKNSLISKGFAFSIVILFIGLASASGININIPKVSTNDETEYWALLIAVGEFASHPKQNIPSILMDVEDLREMLLVSTHWKEENIKVIKGKNATLWNIYKGFRWLNQKEDKDDFSLVSIASHGGQLSRDLWPWDEKDGRDEVIVSYRGFQYPLTNIRDDFLNLLLSLLDSKGVCVIIDCCYAGGFNDPPYFKTRMKEKNMNTNVWMGEFAEDLSKGGRVVLMSCREFETCGSGFTPVLIEGFTGYADGNEDGLVSAEEAFDYAVENLPGSNWNPTIYDGYAGELQLTEVELPPSRPETPIGQIIGETNITYNYSTVSIDPEGGKIRYGWDWDSDYIVDEWSDFVDSNTMVNTSHSWPIEGTYNIRVKAKDELGVKSKWSKHIVVIMSSDNIPDQRQTKKFGAIFLTNLWVAQSFVPSLNKLSKVELKICSYGSGDPQPLPLYIRDSLSGDNLAESSRVISPLGYGKYAWYTFDFEDLDIVPGNTYYIVCEKVWDWGYIWAWNESDCYPLGKVFHSHDGSDWEAHYPAADCCFVTWGKI